MMNRRMILKRVGQMLVLESILLMLPLIVSIIYREWSCVTSFSATIGVTAALGLLSLFGALPFFISGEIPN